MLMRVNLVGDLQRLFLSAACIMQYRYLASRALINLLTIVREQRPVLFHD